jgi:hypothetical protein
MARHQHGYSDSRQACSHADAHAATAAAARNAESELATLQQHGYSTSSMILSSFEFKYASFSGGGGSPAFRMHDKPGSPLHQEQSTHLLHHTPD